MNTTELAAFWGITVEEAIDRMGESGIFVINPAEELSNFQLGKLGVDPSASVAAGPARRSAYEEFIESCVAHKLIFFDCCSLLSPGIDRVLNSLMPYLRKYRRSIVVPEIVLKELNK